VDAEQDALVLALGAGGVHDRTVGAAWPGARRRTGKSGVKTMKMTLATTVMSCRASELARLQRRLRARERALVGRLGRVGAMGGSMEGRFWR